MSALSTLVFLATLSASAAAEMPAEHPDVMTAPHGSPAEAKTQQGKVLTVVDTTGFTYIEVKQENRIVWLAVPTASVKPGDTVHFQDGPVMESYHSKSLDRSFSNVIFISDVTVDNADK